MAVAILGIVVAPLLHTFVTAASTAAKSRKLGDATLAAQNLAERVEGAGLSALVTSPAVALAVGAPDARWYTLSGGSYAEAAGSPAYRAERYHLGVTGLSSGASQFNAMITLDAAAGSANAVSVTRYSPMDAVFSQAFPGAADDPDTMARTEFAAVVATYSGIADPGPTRTITMDLSAEAPSNGITRLSCTLTYRYQFPYHYQQVVTDPVTGLPTGNVTVHDSFTKVIEYDLLPSGFEMEGNDAPSVYLLYNPWYESTGDTIMIHNLSTQKIPFPIFLVKQSTLSQSELAAKEPHYRAEIRLMQDSTCKHTEGAQVHSNAKRYLSGAAGEIPGVTYRVYKGPYVYQAGIAFPDDGSLVARTAENRLYRVTVALYDSSNTDFSGTPIHSFTSTKLQ